MPEFQSVRSMTTLHVTSLLELRFWLEKVRRWGCVLKAMEELERRDAMGKCVVIGKHTSPAPHYLRIGYVFILSVTSEEMATGEGLLLFPNGLHEEEVATVFIEAMIETLEGYEEE
jgi:hypothetical protein